MTYKIVIPTFDRHDVIGKKTLKVLEENNIPVNIIYLFVANKKEYDKYIKVLDNKYHSNILIGKKGLLNQRKYISNYFEEGEKLVHLDDDITNLHQLKVYVPKDKKQNKMKKITKLEQILENCFDYTIKNKASLFGFYPIDNPYFMTDKISQDLRPIIGACFGVINNRKIENSIAIEEKEDYERSILYYLKDKKVIRFNYYAIETYYFKCKGGMQSNNLNLDREHNSKISSQYLLLKYPNIVKPKKPNTNKKNKLDITNVKLIPNPKLN